MTSKKATLTGLIAILLWSTLVGLIRSVSEGFGPVGGAAMIYTLSAVLLLFTVGFPKIRHFPRAYLIIGSLLFVSYELCLSLSLGFANTRTQAIEAGMVNYLWPGLTILLSVLVERKKASLWIVPGLLAAIAGICRVLGGEEGFNFSRIAEHVHGNLISYGLAFAGAIIWAVYCVITRKIAKGSNGITLFFILTAACLWIYYFVAPQPSMNVNAQVMVNLLLTACAMAFGYAAWNVGILHGNVTVLAAASYFVPVISSLLAAVILNSPLTMTFWQGAALVSAGSLMCWWSTRTRKA